MPLLNFTQLTDKVLDHTKVHTIRLPRKRPFKLGDSLHTYVSIKAGMATLMNIKSKKFSDLNLEDALRDGFESLDDMNNCLKIMHPKIEGDSIVDLLTFEPHWDPQRIVKIKNQVVINNNPAIWQLKAMLLDWFHRCPGITEDQHVQAFDLLEKIEDENNSKKTKCRFLDDCFRDYLSETTPGQIGGIMDREQFEEFGCDFRKPHCIHDVV